MARADLMDVRKEVVQVIEPLDTFVQGVHDVVGVLGQLHGVNLLLLGAALPELVEHVQEVLVFFEQSAGEENGG